MLCIGASGAAKYRHRLSRGSLIPWSRSGRRSCRTLSAGSSGACPDAVKSAYRHAGAIHTTESNLRVTVITFFTWLAVRLDLALNWLMSLVSTDHCNFICSQKMIQCTSVNIFNLNDSFIKIWCVIKVFLKLFWVVYMILMASCSLLFLHWAGSSNRWQLWQYAPSLDMLSGLKGHTHKNIKTSSEESSSQFGIVI